MPHEPRVEDDNLSDPAHDDEEGHDWSGEGGATQEGPATAVPEPDPLQADTQSTEDDEQTD